MDDGRVGRVSNVHEVIVCPICREQIHHNYSSPIYSRGRVSSRNYGAGAAMLTQMMIEAQAEHERMLRAAEEACVAHLRTAHSLRFRLWKRLKWKWLIQRRWPWKKVEGELFDYSKSI